LLGGGGGGGPKGTAKSFVKNVLNGNTESASQMLHPDAPIQQVPSTGTPEQGSVSVSGATITSESEGRATVDVSIKLSSGSFSTTSTATVEVRQYEGEWRVWSFQ
jgi:hypothetical protein